MNRAADLTRENETLRGRISRLSEASLRINESLELATVLQGVLDSACALTDARYGVLILLDAAGQIEDCLASGLTADEAREIWSFEAGPGLFEHLRRLVKPVRLRDLQAHVRALGLPELRPPMPVSEPTSFLGAPIRHQGETVGHVFLAERAGRQAFSQEDEDTLVTFAAQAGLVIANARRYRDEQRARADLETLIETSPVGVAVFDARTGAPRSFNREVVRILEHLLLPDRTPEQLLEIMTIRRADGREVSLEALSVAQALSTGETVRGEEVEFQVPDGRRVSALMNATPICSETGAVVSFVVTLQDLTPLKELDRLQAEFLEMVSHELRAPLTSIKGAATTLQESLATLDPVETVQFVRIIEAQANRMRDLISELLDVARVETGTLPVAPQPVAVAELIDEARNLFNSGGGPERLALDVEPELPWVMADRRRIVQVLTNLLSNAAKYSDAGSAIRVTARREGLHVAIAVENEGRGVESERLPGLFKKFARGASAEGEREAPGAGLGLAISKGIVEAHGGRIWAESEGEGRGARFTFTLRQTDPDELGAGTDSPEIATASRRVAKERARVLVVDDDPQTLRYVRSALSQADYAPEVTAEPDEALRIIAKNPPHLVLLDLVLPGADGIDLMQEIFAAADVPVIFLSAYGRDQVIARALELGAADYMVKPFSPTELVGRVKAAIRQHAALRRAKEFTSFRLGDLTITHADRRVTVAGRRVSLTVTEYSLLAELAASPGRVVTHRHLLQRVWGPSFTESPGAVRTMVRRLRHKLGDDAQTPRYIFTEPRVGYRLGMDVISSDAGNLPLAVEPPEGLPGSRARS